jgi:hypothetical protein
MAVLVVCVVFDAERTVMLNRSTHLPAECVLSCRLSYPYRKPKLTFLANKMPERDRAVSA